MKKIQTDVIHCSVECITTLHFHSKCSFSHFNEGKLNMKLEDFRMVQISRCQTEANIDWSLKVTLIMFSHLGKLKWLSASGNFLLPVLNTTEHGVIVIN